MEATPRIPSPAPHLGSAILCFSNSTPQNLRGSGLLLWKAAVKSVDEHIRVNESGHASKDPLSSSPGQKDG